MYKLFITLSLVVFLISGCARQMSPIINSSEQRPGLATKWGETRTSQVINVDFTRANRERPSATGVLYYNDVQGVGAMTGGAYYSVSRLHEIQNQSKKIKMLRPRRG